VRKGRHFRRTGLRYFMERIRSVEHVTCVGDRRDAYRDLVVRSAGKKPLGKPRRR
jgi:hypothetical protein